MSVRLGRVQLRIMQVLWEMGPSSARQISDALNADSPIAHSTVQTLLRGLESKRAVAHEVVGRTFIFRPLIKQQKITRSVTRDLIARVFGGRVSALFSHLLEHENVPVDELRAIRRLIDERTQNQK